tara:strand:+ start:432 stop:1229 length:798 start_codon:yes stop_codon:yes gene_type:complete
MYLGNIPATSFETVQKDRFTGVTGTTVTLSHAVSSVSDILCFVNSVKQDYTNYSVNSTTLTLGGTLVASDIVEVCYVGRTFQTVNPSAGSVNTDQLAANAVTSAKMFSGFSNGTTEFDMWKLTSDLTFANDTVTVITANLARHSYQTDKKGTGMSESSGIFTFPSTGLYYIDFTGFVVATSSTDYSGGGIHATTDNSSYNIMTQNFTNTQGSGDHANFRCHTTFNVTNTSTHKVRFFQFSQNGTGRLESDTNQFRTGFTFMRIGD